MVVLDDPIKKWVFDSPRDKRQSIKEVHKRLLLPFFNEHWRLSNFERP